jgi:hypothetical protein
MFLGPEKRASTHHDSPAKHHNFITKRRVEDASFLKNPL